MAVKRDLFLQNYWQRYPAAPINHGPRSWQWGRLAEWSERHVSILRQDQISTFEFCKETEVVGVRSSVTLTELGHVLRPGDWMAVLTDARKQIDEILLLAPAEVEPRLSRMNQETLQKWNLFRRQVEDFFLARGFSPVTTPTLVSCPGTEAHLEPFSTTLKVGSRTESRFLPTSPELSLKKLLAMGQERIFEIKACFRNGEISERHQPEFLMLEWYRAFASLREIREDVIELLRTVSGDPNLQFKTVSIADLFQSFFSFELKPSTQREELLKLAEKKQIQILKEDSWDDIFFRLFVEFIEPNLNSDVPLFVEKYPPSQAALARLTEDGWGDRFELYWRGLEIANAYHELNDPGVQRQRSENDLSERKRLGKTAVPIDPDFFFALESGMPPSGGIALGMERLFLAQNRKSELAELRFFVER